VSEENPVRLGVAVSDHVEDDIDAAWIEPGNGRGPVRFVVMDRPCGQRITKIAHCVAAGRAGHLDAVRKGSTFKTPYISEWA